MSFQDEIETRCAACAESFEAPVWSLIAGDDETLRNQIKARECNLLLCPHCGEAVMPDSPWIYYEPAAEILAFVFPESWSGDGARWRERLDGDLAKMRSALGERLPADLEPEVFFGQEGLGALLEAQDWRADERDVMAYYAKDLGLSVLKVRPSWARARRVPSELPFRGSAPTREALIAGLRELVAANDRLTAWSEFLAAYEKDAGAGVPPAAR